jgi:hypothetical protein
MFKTVWNIVVYLVTFRWLTNLWKKKSVVKESKPYARLEKWEQPMYDTNTVTDGCAQLNFFQVPLGGTAARATTPKSQTETNMDQGGSLPYPKTFFIKGITVSPDPTVPYSTAVKVIANSWTRIFVGTRDKLIVPTNQVAYIANMSEYRYPGAVYEFETPLRLLPQQNFRVEVNFPHPMKLERGAEVKLQVILHGHYEYKTFHTQQSDGTWTQLYGHIDEKTAHSLQHFPA